MLRRPVRSASTTAAFPFSPIARASSRQSVDVPEPPLAPVKRMTGDALIYRVRE